MKRRLILSNLFAAAALTLVAATAHAQGGLNLSWTDCGANGVSTKTSACANNAAAGALYGTCQFPLALHQLNGQTGVVDVQINAGTLSPWWDTRTNGCVGRTSAVSVSMDFTSEANCTDIWAGQAGPGSNVSFRPGGLANQVRYKATVATATANDADENTEWAMFKITIGGARTAGAGVCTGCADAACIVYNDQFLTQPIGVGDIHVTNELNRRYVLWQSAFTSGVGGVEACPVFVPTRKSTWGSVKSLYR